MSADRIAILIQCMQLVERTCGLTGKSDDVLLDMAMAWIPKLRFVPDALLPACCDWAIENRSNQMTALTLQNMLQAARALVQRGQIKPIAQREPDPFCAYCDGYGVIFGLDPDDGCTVVEEPKPFRIWEDAVTGQRMSEGYTSVRFCDCEKSRVNTLTATAEVGDLMRRLARLAGEIPNPDREQQAAIKLLRFGWSVAEILDCWQDLADNRQRPVYYSDVLPVIGRRYFSTLVAGMSLSGAGAIAAAVVLNPVSEQQARQDKAARVLATEIAYQDRVYTQMEESEEL